MKLSLDMTHKADSTGNNTTVKACLGHEWTFFLTDEG